MKRPEESDTNNHSTTNNPQRTNHKPDWRLYAAAGAAAIATTSAADAAIIYVNPPVKPTATLGAHPVSAFHLTTGGGVAASVKIGHFAGNHPGTYALVNAAAGVIGTALSGLESPNIFAWQFSKGQAISTQNGAGAKGNGILRAYVNINPFFNTHQSVGYFDFGKMEFAGFQMPASKGGGLGWMRLEVFDGGNGPPDQVEAIDWAYNNAGGGINAGQGASVPEPSALGLLALGSAGVLAWRRRRNADPVASTK